MNKRDPKITSKIMASIKSKNTKPELMLRKVLWEKGYRYRVHYQLKGKPDIVFTKKKTVIFIDGDFWHGNNWEIRGLSNLEEELATYSEFWQKKILRNIERDKENSIFLEKEGWTVLRYWESDIKKHIDDIVSDIIAHLEYKCK